MGTVDMLYGIIQLLNVQLSITNIYKQIFLFNQIVIKQKSYCIGAYLIMKWIKIYNK